MKSIPGKETVGRPIPPLSCIISKNPWAARGKAMRSRRIPLTSFSG